MQCRDDCGGCRALQGWFAGSAELWTKFCAGTFCSSVFDRREMRDPKSRHQTWNTLRPKGASLLSGWEPRRRTNGWLKEYDSRSKPALIRYDGLRLPTIRTGEPILIWTLVGGKRCFPLRLWTPEVIEIEKPWEWRQGSAVFSLEGSPGERKPIDTGVWLPASLEKWLALREKKERTTEDLAATPCESCKASPALRRDGGLCRRCLGRWKRKHDPETRRAKQPKVRGFASRDHRPETIGLGLVDKAADSPSEKTSKLQDQWDLRLVDQAGHCALCDAFSDSTFCRSCEKFRRREKPRRRQHHLSLYASPEDAADKDLVPARDNLGFDIPSPNRQWEEPGFFSAAWVSDSGLGPFRNSRAAFLDGLPDHYKVLFLSRPASVRKQILREWHYGTDGRAFDWGWAKRMPHDGYRIDGHYDRRATIVTPWAWTVLEGRFETSQQITAAFHEGEAFTPAKACDCQRLHPWQYCPICDCVAEDLV